MVVWFDIIWVTDQENPFSLTHVLRFYDIRLVLESSIVGFPLIIGAFHGSCMFFKLNFKLVVLNWQYECFWKKIILIRKLFLHFHQISSKFAFIWNHSNARELRYSLIRLDFCKSFRGYWIVKPGDIKVGWITWIISSVYCPIVVIRTYRWW